MESINLIIQKFLDTYLLPAVASTFIAIIYFSYKCDGTNSRRKPLTIFKEIFHLERATKNCVEKATELTEMDSVQILPPVELPPSATIQIESEFLDKSPHKKFQETKSVDSDKLQHIETGIITDEPSKTPKHLFSGTFGNTFKILGRLKEVEPVWDYYDVIHHLKAKVHREDELKSKMCTDEQDSARNTLDISDFTSSTVSLKGKKQTEIFKKEDDSYNEDEVLLSKCQEIKMKLSNNYWQFAFE